METADFLNTFPRLALFDGSDDAQPQRAPAHVVGPYRLLRELGRGGMGTVWLAERSDGSLKRPVALKLPHPGLARSAFAQRLERERDILASLAHPNIARLYDTGVTAEGQPFLALEYVQGENLIEHCDTLRLDLRGRIQLFQPILATDIRQPSDAKCGEAQAYARGLSALGLARALRGDLDTIILKALKKAPMDRYATAEGFRRDLQSHLDGSVVLARPDTLAYRTRTFVHRHRVGVSASGLVALALCAGLVSTAIQARRATEQAARARAVQDFLISLFNEADPVKAQGRVLTARQMLDRGQRDLRTKLADQPGLQALMDGVIVDLYIKLGDEGKALPLAEARRDLTLKLEGPQSLAYGDAVYALARVHGGMSHHQVAYETYAQAASVLQHHSSERAAELLLIEGHSSTQLAMLDRTDEAIDRLLRLLPKLEAQFGPDSWELLRYQASLAATYSDRDQHALAAALIAQVVPKLERVADTHALDANDLRADLGYAMWNARQYPEAEGLLRRAIADADRLLSPANTLSVMAQRTLGLALGSQGKFSEAARTLDDSVQRAV